MIIVFYFWLVYGWCMASLELVPVAMPTLIFWAPYKLVNLTELIINHHATLLNMQAY